MFEVLCWPDQKDVLEPEMLSFSNIKISTHSFVLIFNPLLNSHPIFCGLQQMATLSSVSAFILLHQTSCALVTS